MTQPITVVCCKWSDKKWPSAYTSEHVNILAESVERHLNIPHRFVCFTDDSKGLSPEIGVGPMWPDSSKRGRCFRRLKLFQEEMARTLGTKVVSIDLDSVVCGPLDDLFSKAEDFKAWRDTQPPRQFNGSLFMFNPESTKDIYEVYRNKDSIDAVVKKANLLGMVCDDQAVMSLLRQGFPAWDSGDGVLSYKNDVVKRLAGKLPGNAKIVFFHGNPKPWDLKETGWIADHWRRRKTLVVLGGAACVWDDLDALLMAYGGLDKFKICAINDIGARYAGKLDYWVSLHPEKMGAWQEKREGRHDYITASHIKYNLAGSKHIATSDWGGSSGLFACKLGVEEGFEKIILCGVPMTPQNHFFNDKPWESADAFFTAWEPRKKELFGKVFSMSGRTREMFGHPWL